MLGFAAAFSAGHLPGKTGQLVRHIIHIGIGGSVLGPRLLIEALGKRVLGLHLKGWSQGGEERVAGEGGMDLVAVARALKNLSFAGPVMLELELDADNPVPGLRKGIDNWRKAVAQA